MGSFVPYSDKAQNAFVKSNLFYSDNLFLTMQDPTIFGFKLFFHFNQPDSGLLWGAGTEAEPPANTALQYLLTIGDYQRAHYLKKFLYLLAGINNQTPWFFQEISGLKEAWARDFSKPLLVDKAIEIECIESVDMRITALMDFYRKACFDWKFRREVVPVNLRQFKMSVYVYESRIFQNPNDIALALNQVDVNAGFGGNLQGDHSRNAAILTGNLIGPDETRNDPNTPNVNIVEGVPMSVNRNLFHFDYCEFDVNDTTHLDGVSNVEPANVKAKFKIKYESSEEENLYTWWAQLSPNHINPAVADSWIPSMDAAALDNVVSVPGVPGENPPTIPAGGEGFLKNLANNLKDQGQAKLDKLKSIYNPTALAQRAADQAAAKATNFVNSRLTAALLGNVYGFSPLTLAGDSGLQSLTNTVLDAGASLVNQSTKNKAGGNAFEGSTKWNDTTKIPPGGIPHASHGIEPGRSSGWAGQNDQNEGPSISNKTGTPSSEGADHHPPYIEKAPVSQGPAHHPPYVEKAPVSQGPDHHPHKTEKAPAKEGNEGESLKNTTGKPSGNIFD